MLTEKIEKKLSDEAENNTAVASTSIRTARGINGGVVFGFVAKFF